MKAAPIAAAPTNAKRTTLTMEGEAENRRLGELAMLKTYRVTEARSSAGLKKEKNLAPQSDIYYTIRPVSVVRTDTNFLSKKIKSLYHIIDMLSILQMSLYYITVLIL